MTTYSLRYAQLVRELANQIRIERRVPIEEFDGMCVAPKKWRNAKGEDRINYCGRFLCPCCGPMKIRDTMFAVAMMNPNWMGYFTSPAQDPKKAWKDVNRVWSKLRAGDPWFEAAAVAEPNPNGRGFHIHFLIRADGPVDESRLQRIARSTMGYTKVEPRRKSTRTAAGYVFKSGLWTGPMDDWQTRHDDEHDVGVLEANRGNILDVFRRLRRYRMLNGRYVVRTTRGYFRDPWGRPIGVEEAIRRARIYRKMWVPRDEGFLIDNAVEREIASFFI